VSQGLKYNIDIVFCIDVTGSMTPVIDLVKENVRKFPKDLRETCAVKEKIVNTLRIRTIAFRDFGNDSDALNASDFFVVEPSTELAKFESFVNGLVASGGGDEPESALEALAIAQGSNWTHEGDKQRHVIVMFTDASAHKLESRVGEVPGMYREQVPSSLDGLTDRWDGNQAVRLKKLARRLVIFGPDAYPWNVIGDAWGQTIWLPSQAGKGLEDVEYKAILEVVANTI
jgi:hypothetical protein